MADRVLVWDPFFPDGSLRILNSRISNILPIPDAALGAISYLVDAVTGAIGWPRALANDAVDRRLCSASRSARSVWSV